MHKYVVELKSLFVKNANLDHAAPMKKYMRDQFEYLGIKSPQVKLLLREHITHYRLPTLEDVDEISLDLWSLPQREFHYAAISLMERLEKNLPSLRSRRLNT
jgi:3-methyladenine DNA glycosylase AlkD